MDTPKLHLRRRADELLPGDRISAVHLPFKSAGTVLFVRAYGLNGQPWVFVAYVDETGYHDSTVYNAYAIVYLDAAASTGLDYSRSDDGPAPQPTAGRVPPSYGEVTDGPDPNTACAAHDDAHLGRRCPDLTSFGEVTDAAPTLVPLLKLPMRDEKPRTAHPSWPAQQELKPWESLAAPADRVAASMRPIDPDSSMEAHYDAEADLDDLTRSRGESARPCIPECGGGRQCRCQGGWS